MNELVRLISIPVMLVGIITFFNGFYKEVEKVDHELKFSDIYDVPKMSIGLFMFIVSLVMYYHNF